jgi:hypothetical protein
VQPVSAMREVGTLLVRVMVEADEGPSDGRAVGIEFRTIRLHFTSKTLGLGTVRLVMLGSPRPQVEMGGVGSMGAGGPLGATTAAAARPLGL